MAHKLHYLVGNGPPSHMLWEGSVALQGERRKLSLTKEPVRVTFSKGQKTTLFRKYQTQKLAYPSQESVGMVDETQSINHSILLYN